MTNLTAEQEAQLVAIARADLKYKAAATVAEKKIREMVERELEAEKMKRDVLAYQASQAGIPTIRIAKDGFHTTSSKTAKDAIAAGARFGEMEFAAESEDADTIGAAFARVPGGFQFTLGDESVEINDEGDPMSPWNGAADVYFGEDDKWRQAAREWMEAGQ